MFIYKITNKINGKIYIGQTSKTIEKRFKEHFYRSKFSYSALTEAICKYGRENFIIEQIDIATTQDELNQKEIYWIKFYDSTNRNLGYNLKHGGNCAGSPTQEVRDKISKANTGKSPSKETRIKISEKMKVRIFTPEHRKNISKSLNEGAIMKRYAHPPKENRKSVFKYVTRSNNDKKWRCGFTSKNCPRFLKRFNQEIFAGMTADIYTLKYHPEGSYLNFPCLKNFHKQCNLDYYVKLDKSQKTKPTLK